MLILKIILITVAVIAVLYLLAIMPHMRNRPNLTPFKGRYYAHRGLHNNKTEAPENTLAAFRKAVEAGYGIEMDIQLTKDKVPVVIHDYTLKRVCKKDVRVDSLTLKELRQYTVCKSKEKIPTLAEVLKLVDGRVPLIVEFKVEATDLSLCEVAPPMLDQYKGVWCMESFNPLCVRWYKKNRPGVMRGQLSDHFVKSGEKGNRILFWLLKGLFFNFLTKPDFIAYNHHYPNTWSLVIDKVVYRIPTFAWTIRSQEELEAARKRFDFMIFDRFIPNIPKGNE
ncbi:MAG: glycerophosphodiester phosphodiesterase [Lachnospiraceae bacterium]|jgi:glycerophosphoryl diester phosphodiesterase|nr:glycerophosphodiester phosphodiesterase [Lachnospiraceae bacterium]